MGIQKKLYLENLIAVDPGEIYVDPVNCVTGNSFSKILCGKWLFQAHALNISRRSRPEVF